MLVGGVVPDPNRRWMRTVCTLHMPLTRTPATYNSRADQAYVLVYAFMCMLRILKLMCENVCTKPFADCHSWNRSRTAVVLRKLEELVHRMVAFGSRLRRTLRTR